MLRQARRGGPGPATLLFRQQHRHLFSTQTTSLSGEIESRSESRSDNAKTPSDGGNQVTSPKNASPRSALKLPKFPKPPQIERPRSQEAAVGGLKAQVPRSSAKAKDGRKGKSKQPLKALPWSETPAQARDWLTGQSGSEFRFIPPPLPINGAMPNGVNRTRSGTGSLPPPKSLAAFALPVQPTLKKATPAPEAPVTPRPNWDEPIRYTPLASAASRALPSNIALAGSEAAAGLPDSPSTTAPVKPKNLHTSAAMQTTAKQQKSAGQESGKEPANTIMRERDAGKPPLSARSGRKPTAKAKPSSRAAHPDIPNNSSVRDLQPKQRRQASRQASSENVQADNQSKTSPELPLKQVNKENPHQPLVKSTSRATKTSKNSLSNTGSRPADVAELMGQINSAWARITQSTEDDADYAVSDDYKLISDNLGSLLGAGKLKIGLLASQQSEMFHHICHMAAEAGARSWTSGLNAILLELLRVGRPMDVITVFHQFCERALEIRGIDPTMRNSPKREERLSSRLSDSFVVTPATAYVAAHTLMSSFGPEQIGRLLKLGVSLNTTNALEDIHVVTRVIPSEFKTSMRQNIDKFKLSVTLYHPWSAIRLIRFCTDYDHGRLRTFYDQVMAACMGPKRFVIPAQHANDIEFNGNVLLTFDVWRAFFFHFGSLGDSVSILKMLHVDVPACYGKPMRDLSIYAMLGLAQAYTKVSDKEQKNLKATTTKIFEDIRRTWHLSSEVCVAQLRTLSMTDQYELVLPWYHKCRQLQHAFRDPLDLDGPLLDATLVVHLCRWRRWETLERFLDKWQKRNKSENTPEQARAFSIMVSHVVEAKTTYARRRELLMTLMKLRHSDLDLQPVTWGIVLRFLLESVPVETGCRSLAQMAGDTGEGSWWSSLIVGLCGPYSNRTGTTRKCLDAAIYIAKVHIGRNRSVAESVVFQSWQSVFEAITRSELSAEAVTDYYNRTIKLVPERARRGISRQIVMANLAKDDRSRMAVGLHWFDTMEKTAHDYRLVFDLLLSKGERALVIEKLQYTTPETRAAIGDYASEALKEEIEVVKRRVAEASSEEMVIGGDGIEEAWV